MKQLTCEMCGSTDLVKQDGVFVCQTCGCKYSIEEARKMMVEGTVEVTGTVNTNNIGTYEVFYKVKDSSDNEVVAKRIVKVVDSEGESPWSVSTFFREDPVAEITEHIIDSLIHIDIIFMATVITVLVSIV